MRLWIFVVLLGQLVINPTILADSLLGPAFNHLGVARLHSPSGQDLVSSEGGGPSLLVVRVAFSCLVVSSSIGLMVLAQSANNHKPVSSQASAARSSRPPPVVPGGLPLLGSGVQFGRNAVHFLLTQAQQLGNVFTVRLPFNRIHFVMSPHDLGTMYAHTQLEFNPIQEMVNRNVFGFRLCEARKIIREVSKSARSQLGISTTFHNFVATLADSVSGWRARIDGPGSAHTLKGFLADVQFRAIFNSIFGNSDDQPFNFQSSRRDFDIFHRFFNYLWLGFPLWMFPKAAAALHRLVDSHPTVQQLLARHDLSDYIRVALTRMSTNGQTHADVVGHNLVFLHVNYNTMKATYWILNNLLAHPEAEAALLQELHSMIDAAPTVDGRIQLSVDHLESLPVLDSVINESFRLASGVLVIREVVQDSTLESVDVNGQQISYQLRRGEKVAFYPPALHHNPLVFDSPNEFRYDRFLDNQKIFCYQGQPINPRYLVQPYGTLCPGQRLSRLQIKITLLYVLTNFRLRLAAGETPSQYNTSSYGHEILPPVTDLRITVALLAVESQRDFVFTSKTVS